MMRALVLAGLVVGSLATTAVPASAELVFFASGRSLSVKAVRADGHLLTLHLRTGGFIVCDADLIVRVAPDEIAYPEDEVLQAESEPQEDQRALPPDVRTLVEMTAVRHGVDPALVDALIQVESAYLSTAISSKGARGLMQLMPSTGRQYGALDLLDPAVNVDAGVRHLKRLLARYDLPVALAAYNAGEGAIARFGGIPPFRETRNYVSRILRLLGRV